MSRMARLEQIPWWNSAMLAEATVLLAGVGAVGNEVLKNLALMGVGRVVLVDRDKVALHNLSRSVLFRPEHVGMAKAKAAAESALGLAPGAVFVPLEMDVAKVSPALAAWVDVAIGALDSLAAQVRLGRLCRVAGIPWVQGGLGDATDLFKATLATHPGEEGPCLECRLPEGLGDRLLAEDLPRGGCAEAGREAEAAGGVPSTPMTASILGGLLALEALAVLHARRGLPGPDSPPAWGTHAHWNLRVPSVHALRGTTVRPECPWHEPVRVHRLDRQMANLPIAHLWDVLGPSGMAGLEGHLVRHAACPGCRASADWRWCPDLPAPCPHCGTPDPTAESLRHLPRAHAQCARTPRALGIPPGIGLRWFDGDEAWTVTWPGVLGDLSP